MTETLSDPASYMIEITPDDAAQPMVPTRALGVNEDGLVMVTMLGGQKADIFIAAGAPMPLRVIKVWRTGTTAQGIRGLL